MEAVFPAQSRSPAKSSDPTKEPSKVETAIAKAPAALRADDDMNQVLDANIALEPNAIEKCTPEEARAQPAPTDAAMSLLRKQRRDTFPQALVPGVNAVDRSQDPRCGRRVARTHPYARAGRQLPPRRVLPRQRLGVGHEFFGAAAALDKARQAQRLVGERLRHAFM